MKRLSFGERFAVGDRTVMDLVGDKSNFEGVEVEEHLPVVSAKNISKNDLRRGYSGDELPDTRYDELGNTSAVELLNEGAFRESLFFNEFHSPYRVG